MREEQGSPTEKLTLLEGGGTGEGRGGAGGPGGGRPKEGAKKAKEGDRGVSGIARQGAQIQGSMGRGQRGGE